MITAEDYFFNLINLVWDISNYYIGLIVTLQIVLTIDSDFHRGGNLPVNVSIINANLTSNLFVIKIS